MSWPLRAHKENKPTKDLPGTLTYACVTPDGKEWIICPYDNTCFTVDIESGAQSDRRKTGADSLNKWMKWDPAGVYKYARTHVRVSSVCMRCVLLQRID